MMALTPSVQAQKPHSDLHNEIGVGTGPFSVFGGFIIGISETFLVALGYSTFSDAFTFVLLIIILLVRPTGLFGEAATDKV